MRGSSCSRPRARTWTRSSAFRRRSRSSSAPAAAAARAPWRRSPRSTTSCACCTSSSARSTARTATWRSSRRAPASIAARLLRDYKRQAHRAAGAAGHRPQGLLHRSRQVGGEEGLPEPARRRRAAADGALAAPVALQGAHHRAAGGRGRRRREERGGAARRRSRARSTSARGWCTCSRPKCGARHGVLHQARLPGLRQELRRTRSAPVLLQLQARLVRELLRHGRRDAGLR